MSDLKTSLLVKQQVPEFVRDEHPKFIAFLEAYYEFLEQKQGTQLNDLTSEAKQLRYLSDIDESLDDFESNFFNTYASLVPQNVDVSKEFLIKKLLPLYLSKGSEASFKLLFRLLFGQEVQISYPKDQILRASDGKWLLQDALRASLSVKSVYVADGINREFKIAQQIDLDEITVSVNDSITTNYYIKKELKKLVLNTIPSSNSTVTVTYNNFDINLLNNRKVTGKESGASGIIENSSIRQIAGDNYFELYLNRKKIEGNFINGETLTSTIIVDNQTINLEISTLSDLKTIKIIDGGSNYNVGDLVIVQGPATRQAKAVVDKIATGFIEEITLIYGGSGFQRGTNVVANGIPTVVFDSFVSAVDISGQVSSNTINVFNEIIGSINVANLISSANFGFPSFSEANANTIIANALSQLTISNIGPILAVTVNSSSLVAAINPEFNALAPIVSNVDANNIVYLNNLGIIGRIDIVSGGTGYNVGEYLTFTRHPDDFLGNGANVVVSTVSGNGTITQIKFNSGGTGYTKGYFPTINVATVSGNGANLVVNSLLGDGEVIDPILEENVSPGQILSIRILDPGVGYKILPRVDLTKSGDGTAIANVELRSSLVELEGKWTTTDSLLSSEDRRIQGRDYYVNYSYVLSSKIEFERYKIIFKQLVKPAGFLQYAEYRIDEEILSPNISTVTIPVTNTISGRVSTTNNSIIVIGSNTKFNIAASKGILTVGSNVAINSVIRTVNSIISNTEFTVSNTFTFTSNDQILVVV